MVSSGLPPLEEEWGISENRAAGNWISLPQFDATFDGALTRSMIDIYESFYNFSIQNVHSGGAGNAELASVLAESGYEVTAVDKDARTVARLSRSETPDGLTISEGDIASPEETESYDLSYQDSVLQELVGPELDGCPDDYLCHGFTGIRDSLKPGGLAFIVVPNLVNMLEVLDHEEIVRDDVTLEEGSLAYARFTFENGDILSQYGFTHEGQFPRDEVERGPEWLGFDPRELTTIEELARKAGLETAATEPLEQWAENQNRLKVDGTERDFEFVIGDSFIELPAEPSAFTRNERNGKRIQEVIQNFERENSERLRRTIVAYGVERYRKAQLRNPELGPRAHCYVFRRPVS